MSIARRIALIVLALASVCAATARAARVDRASAARALAECEARPQGCSVDDVQALASQGIDAARAALDGFEAAPLSARRQRAWLVRTAGDASVLLDVLHALQDPSALVRAELVPFLARADLAEADLVGRTVVLARLASGDPSPLVRAASIRALADLDRAESWNALDSVFDTLTRADRLLAATELARSPHAAALVARRVSSGLAVDPTRANAASETSDVLGVLLMGASKNVADRAHGGESRADRAAVLAALRSSDPVLLRAGTAAFDALLRRIGQLGDGPRARAVLEGFRKDGIDARLAAFQTGRLALLLDGDAAAALRAADAIATAAGDPLSDDGRSWRARAALLRANAELADARDPASSLAEAIAICEGALSERLDRAAKYRRDEHEAWLALRETAEFTAMLARIARVVPESKLPSDTPGAATLDETYPMLVTHAVRAHALELETMISHWDGDRDPGAAWDSLDADLSPLSSILQNPRLPHWPTERTLNARRMLLRALASVAPGTLPGFEPWPDVPPPLRDPVADPARRPLARALQYAQFDALDRQRDRLETKLAQTLARDPSALDFDLLQRIEEIRYTLRDFGASFADEKELPLLKPIFPSSAALDLARDLTDEGRIDEARALAVRMREDLEKSSLTARYVGGLELAAEIEMAIGATYTQGDEPERAETELVKALERLQAIEDLLAQQGVRGEGLGRVRLLRRGALVSLAVNANVKQKDPVKATAYFERAYALSQDDFMRVLLACYRARGGRTAEARTLLSGVTPSPSTHYNMACTWALLGEKELAFEFLKREFEENRDTPGALQKQREWARKDPDLDALRSDPRFRELVGP